MTSFDHIYHCWTARSNLKNLILRNLSIRASTCFEQKVGHTFIAHLQRSMKWCSEVPCLFVVITVVTGCWTHPGLFILDSSNVSLRIPHWSVALIFAPARRRRSTVSKCSLQAAAKRGTWPSWLSNPEADLVLAFSSFCKFNFVNTSGWDWHSISKSDVGASIQQSAHCKGTPIARSIQQSRPAPIVKSVHLCQSSAFT